MTRTGCVDPTSKLIKGASMLARRLLIKLLALMTTADSAAESTSRTIEFVCLPGPEAVAELIGELRRIGCGAKRLGCQDSGGLVMLTAAGAVRAHRDDHVRPERADMTHEITKNLLVPPRRTVEASGCDLVA